MSNPGPASGGLRPDPGQARERTRLAWARTGLTFAAVGAVILRRELVIGLAALALTPLVWALGLIAEPRDGGARPVSRRLLLVTATVTLVALLAVVVALLGRAPASLGELLPAHRWRPRRAGGSAALMARPIRRGPAGPACLARAGFPQAGSGKAAI